MKNIKIILLLLLSTNLFAQINPPGMPSRANYWMASGINKQFETFKLAGSLGYGRSFQSHKHDIYVVGLDVSQKKHHWKYGAGFSYRHQNEESDIIALQVRQEMRGSLSLSRIWAWNQQQFTLTAKPELRLFRNKVFEKWNAPAQFRTRFKATYKLNLDAHSIIAAAESLQSASRKSTPEMHWEHYDYSDTRLTFYYGYKIPDSVCTFYLGYMLDFYGWDLPSGNHSLIANVVVTLPSR